MARLKTLMSIFVIILGIIGVVGGVVLYYLFREYVTTKQRTTTAAIREVKITEKDLINTGWVAFDIDGDASDYEIDFGAMIGRTQDHPQYELASFLHSSPGATGTWSIVDGRLILDFGDGLQPEVYIGADITNNILTLYPQQQNEPVQRYKKI